MKSRTDSQVLIFLLAGCFSKVLAQTRTCFTTGPNFPLPNSISYDDKVECDTSVKLAFPLTNVPDLFIQAGTQRFSFSLKDIGFQTSSAPSVMFALRTFGVLTQDKLGVLDIYARLYGAMNAAVRSNNMKEATQAVKGAQNFLGLHIRRLAKDTTTEKLSSMFTQVRRACLRCTQKDLQELDSYAINNGIIIIV